MWNWMNLHVCVYTQSGSLLVRFPNSWSLWLEIATRFCIRLRVFTTAMALTISQHEQNFSFLAPIGTFIRHTIPRQSSILHWRTVCKNWIGQKRRKKWEHLCMLGDYQSHRSRSRVLISVYSKWRFVSAAAYSYFRSSIPNLLNTHLHVWYMCISHTLI